MKIININGGLGNQMFQYALYVALTNDGQKAIMDTSHIFMDMENLGRCTIFDTFVLDKDYKVNKCTYNRIIRKFVIPIFQKIFGTYRETADNVGTYEEKLIKLKHGYIDGYWQTEKYFEEHCERVRQSFLLKRKLSDSCTKILKKIQNEVDAVSIHIRLGDYDTLENQKLYGNICTVEYYQKAIRCIKQHCPNPKFFVFSNDVKNAKKILTGFEYEIIDANDESTGWADMYLMSQCKHNIIANSSFSWWGAWLNQNPDKIVVAPHKWLNTREMPDICPESWIRL